MGKGAPTLVAAAVATAARWPHREAVRVDDVGVTHAALQDASRRLAGWLSARGTTTGNPVLIAAPNSIGLVVAYLSALRAGAMVTLVNPTLGRRELGRLVERVRPSATLASTELAQQLQGLGSTVPGLTLDVSGAGIPAEVRSLAPVGDVAVDSGDVAHLAVTSGTTGPAKLAPLTHANVVASVRAVMDAWRWTSDDRLVHALPLQHAHGLTAVHLSLLSGSRSMVLSRFEPATLCNAIVEHRATVLFGVPASYDRLLGWPGFERADLSSLRLAVSGSAPLSARHSDAVTSVLGHRPLERYGLTEAGFVLSNLYDGERLPGAVGYPLPGAEVRIVGTDGAAVADGAVGEIVVRGPQVFAGYSGADPTDAFLEGGWFRTGDLGIRSPVTGAVSITGRSKELIITGGLNVYPGEIEQVLETQPCVRAAAVAGRPSNRWGEEVVAFVVAEEGLDLEELAAAVACELAPYKRPKSYVVVADLPRNHMGKVVRAELTRRYRQAP